MVKGCRPCESGDADLIRSEPLTDGLGDELAHQLLQVTAASLPRHDLHHLAADLADLAALGVAGALDLQAGAWRLRAVARWQGICGVRASNPDCCQICRPAGRVVGSSLDPAQA